MIGEHSIGKNGDIDILVATNEVGLGWYENQSLTWVWHSLDNTIGYHRVSATDVEMDGDLDIIGVDNSISANCGDIYLFRNDGSMVFTKELAADITHEVGFRVYPANFNSDIFPDIYCAAEIATKFFLNDGTGNFTQSASIDIWSGYDFDGAWASDIDMDGDVDLVCGVHGGNPNANGFYALLNDGAGANFTPTFLPGTDAGGRQYGDGLIARDIDLDGFPDIAGAYSRVGWFRQAPSNPLNFTLYDLDIVSNNETSHWVYASPICEKCIPEIDLLVTHTGAHIVYENNMLVSFTSNGYLESSILRLDTTYVCSLNYFGYESCVPNDSSLAFYWRAGNDSAEVVNSSWQGPYFASTGMQHRDSFYLNIFGKRFFQYKVEFKGGDDIAVLYDVWLTYNCPPIGIMEDAISKPIIKVVNDKLILTLQCGEKVSIKIYDITGRLKQNLCDDYLPSGEHKFKFILPSGIYFSVINYSSKKEVIKIIKLR